METKNIRISTPGRELEERIEEYFGDAKHRVSVCLVASTYYVQGEYWDFKPKKEVVRTIESLGADVEVERLERLYSQYAIDKQLSELYYEDDLTIYIADGPDAVRPVPFPLWIEDMLRNKSF